MQTLIKKIDEQSLILAKQLILDEQLVAFPTETVYGLGALAYSDTAVKRIYQAKGRPSDNPLIVHVHKNYDLSELVEAGGDYVEKIVQKFLPGPLTIVYKSKGKVSPVVSCGLDTLAIRVPESEAAQSFLSYVNQPIAAPSANISKHVSPVTAMHVYNDFKDKIPLVLDGGRCSGGIESTVLDATGPVPVILRKGLITAEMIASVTGECLYAAEDAKTKVRSPGMKYRHYCPNCETKLFERSQVKQAIDFYDSQTKSGKKVVFLADYEMSLKIGERNLLMLGKNSREMAANLYDMLHEGEKFDIIISFELQLTDELMLSVNNRFSKAFAKADK